MGSPQVIEGHSSIYVIIFVGKRVVVSGTMIALRKHRKAVDSLLTPLSNRPSSKLTLHQRSSLFRSNMIKIAAVLGRSFFLQITFEPLKINFHVYIWEQIPGRISYFNPRPAGSPGYPRPAGGGVEPPF